MDKAKLKEIISRECPDIESNFVFNDIKHSLFSYKTIGGSKYGMETIFPPGSLGEMTESRGETFMRMIKEAFLKAEREHWEKEATKLL